MSETVKTYTYRGGQKVELEKSPDQMAVRILPDHLDNAVIIKSKQVSFASTQIIH